MEELLKTFTIPDNTVMEEHTIVVDGGVIIGNHSDIGFGVLANSVIAGERVKINGNVIGTDEIRIDMWSHVGGDVRTKNDAYIGEFVNIDGKLVVENDLNIGKDVNIGGGFEAKGWIYVRNPTTNILIYIFLYLTMLIRMGKNEEVEKALDELFMEDTDNLNVDNLLIIPSGSKIDLESIRVPEKAIIGSNCRIIGNIRAASLSMGSNNTLFGSIRTSGEIIIGEANNIHGNIVARGDVRVNKGTHVLGEINGGKIIIHEEAKVDGPMRAPGGVVISTEMAPEEKEAARTGSILDQAAEPFLEQPEITGIEISKKTMAKKRAASEAKAGAEGIAPPIEKSTAVVQKKRLTTAIRLSNTAEENIVTVIKEKKIPVSGKSTAKEHAVKKPAAKGPGEKIAATKTTATKTAAGKTAPSKKKSVPKKSTASAVTSKRKTTANQDSAKKKPAKKRSTVKSAGEDKLTDKKDAEMKLKSNAR